MAWMRRAVVSCVVGYSLCFMLWRLLVASPLYAQWWQLQISELVGLWVLAPVPFFFITGIFFRSRWLWLALIVPLLWFGYEYGGLFLPDFSTRAWARGEETTLRLMTLNTWKKHDWQGDLEAALGEWQPDLIALQEVSPRLLPDLAKLSEEWPYQIHANIRVLTTVALLSKVPILAYDADNLWEGCHCMQVLLDWHGRPVRVIVVHIRAPSLGVFNVRGRPLRLQHFDTVAQTKSYAVLLSLIEASSEPVIVLGDFNTTERQAGYRAMYAAGMQDAHASVGWGPGFTYPAPHSRFSWLPLPVIRIDHIFYDEDWRAMQTWTMPMMGSDHQALVADLQWVGGHGVP